MKNFIKIIFVLILFLFGKNNLFSQSNKNKNEINIENIADSSNKIRQSENIIRTANDLKSGNWQDVLSSFLQLSISDLTGSSMALNFKTTLLALKVKADTSLLIDSNYIHQKFARNFQFDFSLKLDSQYKFKGFQGGFTWAIINKRDSSVMSLAGTLVDSLFLVAETDIQLAFIAFQNSLTDSTGHIKRENLKLFNDVKQKIENTIAENGFKETKFFPAEFKPFLRKSYEENIIKANVMFNQELENLRAKPLLTLSVNSTFQNDEQAFNNGEADLVYLQGIKSKSTSTEIDVRLSVKRGDTLIVTKQQRSLFKSSAGINFSLFQGKAQKSIFEFKPYLEYQNILTAPIGNEKKGIFSANADLRLRLTNNLWLPLTIKYDFNKKNLLGFLNVAFNFDAFKKQLASN